MGNTALKTIRSYTFHSLARNRPLNSAILAIRQTPRQENSKSLTFFPVLTEITEGISISGLSYPGGNPINIHFYFKRTHRYFQKISIEQNPYKSRYFNKILPTFPEGILRRLSAPVARETIMYRSQDVSYTENCLRFLNNTSYIRNAVSCARLFDTLIDLIIPPVPKSTVYSLQSTVYSLRRKHASRKQKNKKNKCSSTTSSPDAKGLETSHRCSHKEQKAQTVYPLLPGCQPPFHTVNSVITTMHLATITQHWTGTHCVQAMQLVPDQLF